MHQYGGQRFKIVTEILEWEPPRRLVSRSSGMSFEQVGVAALASTAGGTVLTFDVDARLTHKLFSPFVKRAIRSAHRRVNRDLLALKGLAEAETQGDDV